jgi:hypothetical protein
MNNAEKALFKREGVGTRRQADENARDPLPVRRQRQEHLEGK